MSYQLSIVTPVGKIYEDTVDSLATVGVSGHFEVYSGHAAVISALAAGKLRVRKEGQEISFDITSGVLEVTPEHNVLLLADQAVAQP